jgi:hypothetical protein
MTAEDKRKVREIQSQALREVGPGLEAAVRVRLPGSKRILDARGVDEDDRALSKRAISWGLFVLLVLLIAWGAWTLIGG